MNKVIEFIEKMKVDRTKEYEQCMMFYDNWLEYEKNGEGDNPMVEWFKDDSREELKKISKIKGKPDFEAFFKSNEGETNTNRE